MRLDRVAEPRAELLDELGLVAVAHLGWPGPREALDRDGAVLPDEHVPGRQLADVAEDRVRRGDRVEREERLERVGVDLAARQGAQLGREAQLAADVAVVERLDPVAVAREDEAAARRVPDRDGEHPAQPLGEAGAVLLVEMDERLGVGVGAEGVAGARELVAQLGVVVDLAVLDDDDGAVLVRDRLVAAGEVDDREAPRAERDLAVDVLAARCRGRGGRAGRSSREAPRRRRARRRSRSRRSRT